VKALENLGDNETDGKFEELLSVKAQFENEFSVKRK
jgi:hypothetical protein